MWYSPSVLYSSYTHQKKESNKPFIRKTEESHVAADTKTSYQRRCSVEFWRRNDVAIQSQWKCWYDIETRRCSNVSSRRRDNVVSTWEQQQTTSIKGCLNVVMRRWNVVFRRCINISIATTLRRQVNVGIRRHLWLFKRRDVTLSRRQLRSARPLFNIFKPN